MESDSAEFAEWNRIHRDRVATYLERAGIASPQVGAWPAFEVAPHFGLWCVESKAHPGKIGWWAVAGDCPTDYVSEDGRCHPRAAVENLVKAWSTHAGYLKKGQQPPDVSFGDQANLKELGALLEKRVSLLKSWVADDGMWEDR